MPDAVISTARAERMAIEPPAADGQCDFPSSHVMDDFQLQPSPKGMKHAGASPDAAIPRDPPLLGQQQRRQSQLCTPLVSTPLCVDVQSGKPPAC